MTLFTWNEDKRRDSGRRVWELGGDLGESVTPMGMKLYT